MAFIFSCSFLFIFIFGLALIEETLHYCHKCHCRRFLAASTGAIMGGCQRRCNDDGTGCAQMRTVGVYAVFFCALPTSLVCGLLRVARSTLFFCGFKRCMHAYIASFFLVAVRECTWGGRSRGGEWLRGCVGSMNRR